MIRGYLILLVIVVMYKNRRKKDFFNVSLFSDGKLQQGKMVEKYIIKFAGYWLWAQISKYQIDSY